MLIMKVCHTCDRILGELEADDLTTNRPDSIIEVVGNIAYTFCPDCFNEFEVRPKVFH